MADNDEEEWDDDNDVNWDDNNDKENNNNNNNNDDDDNKQINKTETTDWDNNDNWDDDNNDDDEDGWDDDQANIVDMTIPQGSMVANANIDTIPEVTAKAINSNIDEINMIPLFAGVPDLKSRSRVGAVVAIRVSKLTNITQEQLEVWGLNKDFPYIALKFEFGPFYLNEGKAPTVQVGICRRLSADEPLHGFRLSWTISERCKNDMFKDWPPESIQMSDIPNASAINDLMESTEKEYAICLEALKQCNNDASQALNLMFDEGQLKKIEKKLPSIQKCKEEFRDLMGRMTSAQNLAKSNDNNNNNNDNNSKWNFSLFGGNKNKNKNNTNWQEKYSDADTETQAKQLSEIYQIPVNAAMIAIQELGYDKATDKLSKEDVRNNYIAIANTGIDKVSDFFSATIKHEQQKKNNKSLMGKFKNFVNKSGSNESEEKKNDAFDDDNKNSLNEDDLSQINELGGLIRSSSGKTLNLIKPEHFFRSIVVMSRHNLLLRILCYALKVLLNGNKYCMICDKELAFAGLKPTICSAPFCQFRHDQIGLGFSLASEITHRADICDLLINMTYSAANAGRIQFFFPTGVRGLDASTADESFLMDANGNEKPDLSNFDPVKFANGEAGQPKPNVAKLKTVIDLCPKVDDLKKYANEGDPELKKHLTKIHCLLYPLLVWIITSNRSHLRRLSEKERIKEIDTEYQFALCSQTPEKEARFQKLKDQNSSFLAWHGSPMGNWHSILRMGLRNYSKTKHQSNGAAYGSGIYFGKMFNLSWGYCRPGSNPGWKNSRYGQQCSCMALCEICYHSGDAHHHNKALKPQTETNADNKKKHDSGWTKTKDPKNRWVKTTGIYVVDQEENVTTRFFLIFPKTSGYKQIEANSLKNSIPKVVRTFE